MYEINSVKALKAAENNVSIVGHKAHCKAWLPCQVTHVRPTSCCLCFCITLNLIKCRSNWAGWHWQRALSLFCQLAPYCLLFYSLMILCVFMLINLRWLIKKTFRGSRFRDSCSSYGSSQESCQ